MTWLRAAVVLLLLTAVEFAEHHLTPPRPARRYAGCYELRWIPFRHYPVDGAYPDSIRLDTAWVDGDSLRAMGLSRLNRELSPMDVHRTSLKSREGHWSRALGSGAWRPMPNDVVMAELSQVGRLEFYLTPDTFGLHGTVNYSDDGPESEWMQTTVIARRIRCGDPQATTEPAMLRAALADWQEGPTDGRVCLDPRILPRDTTRPPPTVWSDTVLRALLTDVRVAVDSTVTVDRPGNWRRCAPTRYHPRIALSLPYITVNPREVDIRSEAAFPASHSDTAVQMSSRVTLEIAGGRWAITAHPDQHFRVIEMPRP